MLCTGESLKANITTLGPLVLPFSEQLLFLVNLILRKSMGKKRIKPYIPDFKLAFEHVCIHTGRRNRLMALSRVADCTYHIQCFKAFISVVCKLHQAFLAVVNALYSILMCVCAAQVVVAS